MVEVIRRGIILEKSNLEFENEGVLNPAVIFDNGLIHLFYRAVSKGNRSTIGYCTLSDPTTVFNRFSHPVLVSEHDYEIQGVEDPRIVKIDDLFYLTYTAYDGMNAMGCLAYSSDLKQFAKAGVIVPKIDYVKFQQLVKQNVTISPKYFRFDQCSYYLWDKNVIFFPRRINNKLVFLHRIRPGIQLVCVDSMEQIDEAFWDQYFLDFESHIVLDPAYDHELSYIGGGCPPIETEHGWLLIYHSVRDTLNGYVYSASAALLDLDNPKKEIARLPYPLFGPELEWETNGVVDNVCFPTGALIVANELFIYYGAADAKIACASVNTAELIAELLQYIPKS